MGALAKTNPIENKLDDGWSLGEESTTFTLRSLPENSPLVAPTAEEEGWSLAHESQTSVPAVHAHSTILNPLSEEELEEFSRAELAMGTAVDFPYSENAWFQELRCIVPPKRAPSVSDTVSKLPLRAEQEVPKTLAPAKKKRWWRRR